MSGGAEGRRLGGLDRFKVAAALLVVAIHTAPLLTLNATADFILTRILARVAVPFFLMVTGYFLLPRCIFDRKADLSPLMRSVGRTLILYAAATFLYLPLNLYAGRGLPPDAGSLVRAVFFDGSFYHLWYLPAAAIGVLLVVLLSRALPPGAVAGAALLLYVLGLLGDSYYGLTAQVPPLAALYGLGFQIFSYTRNGLFYAPIFLVLGALLARSNGGRRGRADGFAASGLVLSLALMLAEGLVLHGLGWQRHDSMYLALIPCMYFLFPLVRDWRVAGARALGAISMWIYIIHPMMIIVVRGAAKLLGLTKLLIENHLIHYLAVCALSAVFAVCAERGTRFLKKAYPTGRAWIELDRRNLRHNVDALRGRLPEGCALMPVVKADAYGHGAVLIARELNRQGVRAFCVASVGEGVALRKKGIRGQILILGYTHPEQFYLLRRCRLTQTVLDSAYAKALQAYGKKLAVHVAIDSGMHRLGERYERFEDLRAIFQCPNLVIQGAFTHFGNDDTDTPQDRALTLAQARAFGEALARLEEEGYRCPKRHLLASYGLWNYPEFAADYVRVGIALYGVMSTAADTARCPIPLRPVLSLKARVAVVKDLRAGESAGYGLDFVAATARRIAVLSIGYADGLPRTLSNGVGAVLIRGREARIVGRVCMDQTLVDVTALPDVESGDIAVLIGVSGEREITACDVADQAGTISNEILSRMGKRLERIVV